MNTKLWMCSIANNPTGGYVRQLKTFLCGLELALWALCLGALWGLALWVAPSLFKWLPRPEAALVAARLFYMAAWGAGFVALLLPLLAVFNKATAMRGMAAPKPNAKHAQHFLQQTIFSLRWPLGLMALVLAAVAVELWCIHPHMKALRHTMAEAAPALVPVLKAEFARMHAYSATVYAVKMVGMLVWGLLRYGQRGAHKGAHTGVQAT